MSEESALAAQALKKAALAEFFPRLTANGLYNWNQQGMELLSSEQQQRVNTIGDAFQSRLSDAVLESVADLPMGQEIVRGILERMGTPQYVEELNALGRDITQALDIDMRNVYAGSINISQPVYLGGKLRAMYKSASLADELSQQQQQQQLEQLMVGVDEAYWRVVNMRHKQQLAQQYYDLLDKLSRDVEAMLDAEVASQSDAAQVRVKKNEAQMNLTKADVGLRLSRMVLNQMAGFPLDTVFLLEEDSLLEVHHPYDTLPMEEVRGRRHELQMLRLSQGIADAGVQAARSALLPNIGVTAGYAVSNPNFINGYQQAPGGSFTAGVVVNVPLCHPAALYALKAAKHKRNEIQYQMDDASEKIELQVNKLNFELQVADEKLRQSRANLECAEENLRLADESFHAGLIGLADLMQAQTAWFSAKTDITEAEVAVRMSYLYLRQALGE